MTNVFRSITKRWKEFIVFFLMIIIFYAMVGCPKDPQDYDKLGDFR
jgi:hypothetical protein